MDWQAHSESIEPGTTRITIADASGNLLSFRAFFDSCVTKPQFGLWFTEEIRQVNQIGFHWELPPLVTGRLDQAFECVVVDNHQFATMSPDPISFANQFEKAAGEPQTTVIEFPNLSGDARLLVPLPKSDQQSAYTHLAAFLNDAPRDQVRSFWQLAGALAREQISDTRPYWLSTAGMGVAWLHLRFDSRPKYYRYRPYAQWEDGLD